MPDRPEVFIQEILQDDGYAKRRPIMEYGDLATDDGFQSAVEEALQLC